MKHARTLLVLGLSVLAGTAFAQEIGRMTAVQTSVARDGVPLGKGSGIGLGDTLESNATGLGMIVFKDQSSAKIGPNSRLVIDSFVYGGAASGTSAVRMDRGITRFFGGRISKKGRMEITTPHVVLAVRGGIVDVTVAGGRSVATLRAGKLTCKSGGTTTVITKPGFSCVSDGRQLAAVKNAADFAILDSRSKVAGTDEPGANGPGLAANAPCIDTDSDKLDRCTSREGQLPGKRPETGGGQNVPRIGVEPPPAIVTPTPPPVVVTPTPPPVVVTPTPPPVVTPTPPPVVAPAPPPVVVTTTPPPVVVTTTPPPTTPQPSPIRGP